MDIFAYGCNGITDTRLAFPIINLSKTYETFCCQIKKKREYMTIILKEVKQ